MSTFAKFLMVFAFLSPVLAMAEEGATNTAAQEEGEKPELKKGVNLHLLPAPQANVSKATRPGKVTLESPVAFEKIQGGTANLKWTESKGADSYHLQIATDPNFKWLVKNEFFFKGTSYQMTGLEAGQQYFWRVAGMKADNDPEYLKGFFTNSEFEAK